jgi:cardiolipin synthase (CMP-forming)
MCCSGSAAALSRRPPSGKGREARPAVWPHLDSAARTSYIGCMRASMNIPNVISLFRLVLVPFVVAMISRGEWGLAFGGFLVAGVSDAVDGAIARRFSMRSELGAYLDPIADKALLVSIYVTLAFVGVLAPWLAIIVVFRDVMLVGGVVLAWLLSRPIAIAPLMVSKVNTAAQIGFAALALGAHAFGIEDRVFLPELTLVVAALTIASAAAYLAQWLRHMTR